MSKMLRLELLGLLLLACTQILTEHRDFRDSRNQYGHHHRYQVLPERATREVRVKQGRLRGMVVQPTTNHNLQLVDIFLGVPYADPPMGPFRFSPPRSPQPWRGLRHSQEFAPVCPQVLPKLRDEVKPGRYEYLERHLPYLRNQSEDCLYLNIYAPHQPDGHRNLKKYPVMVFIHGESFEWNSGNPYDGTIIAAYGNVVFVTINFRLGILGFLRPGIRDETASNFGLLDQIAALLWLQQNIVEFGGDPNSVTIVGHGTGAIFANLLLISPVANSKGLFKRAILMSGSALSADAIGKAPLQITKQVAHALNCPTKTDSDLAMCLRNQDVDALLNVKIHKPKYVPAFAPLIDKAVIPDKPERLMENAQLFGRFDLMYGVTESEKFHILPPVALLHGMLDGQRDEILRDHAKATHELEPELVLSKVLEHYGDFRAGFSNEYATKNRDLVLEALSDSGTAAPLIMTANLHSKANPRSYMYVFSHPKAMQDYSGQQRQRTVHGEELPYILGVPLDGSKYDLRGRYNIGEILFSEAMMNWWSSFAYIGNPNVAKRYPYLTDGLKEWGQYDVDWPEYDPDNQTYFNLTIPPNLGSHYRAKEMQFWNEDLPNLLRYPNQEIPVGRIKGPRPEILNIADGIGKYANGTSNKKHETYIGRYTTERPSGEDEAPFPFLATTFFTTSNHPDIESPTADPNAIKSSSVINMVIGFGLVFLLINITAFFYMYRKRQNSKNKERALKRRINQKEEIGKKAKIDKHGNHYGELGYKSDSKPDLNEVIKNDKAYDNNSNFGRKSKLSRQNSGSTIDTHIKVREWIQQEIVHRCSPRFLRKTRETLQKEHQEKLSKQQQEERKKLEQEKARMKKEEPIYDETPRIIVRPGKKSKLPKVSVAVDATPATRTESILNQIPIELTKSPERPDDKSEDRFDYVLPDPSQFQIAPQVVVIEHHHSRSDPLPMENILKSVKPNCSMPRIYESDSGSASSLYAKINPKLKSRLPRLGLPTNSEGSVSSDSKCKEEASIPAEEDIYAKTGSKFTTFGAVGPPNDVNVTCREPIVERECISPEEALRTIKRRNYPKVLPDIEKRRSLPVPSSMFLPKQYGNSLKDYKQGFQNSPFGQPPLPPPRTFGTSKSLDLAEENEQQNENEAITTTLQVGPLLKKQDCPKNNSDPSIIDSCEGNMSQQLSGGSADTIYSNPKCPVHGAASPYSSLSPSLQSMDNNFGSKDPLFGMGLGNPNWYKPYSEEKGISSAISAASSEPRIVISAKEPGRQVHLGSANPIWDSRGALLPEPKIVITPRVGNLLGQATQRLNQTTPNLLTASSGEMADPEPRIVIAPNKFIAATSPTADLERSSNAGSMDTVDSVRSESDLYATLNPPRSFDDRNINKSTGEIKEMERKEPRIIITPRDPKQTGSSCNMKQPKIIIKPTTSTLPRSRDQRNIPKVSAIPSPERQNVQNIEKDKEQRGARPPTEKPPLREKPKVTRIPSFSRRKEDSLDGAEKPTLVYEKSEIVQRIEAVPNKASTAGTIPEGKSSIPTLFKKENEKSSSTDSSNSNGNSSNSNTGTIKRKPAVPKK
ncbi:uncharacterized protein [Prorops nasuta]|uniref:uncharacterized protein n=1 Tax=Prorops nasuta TaxID=863751 RepID=UPI0034CE5E3C